MIASKRAQELQVLGPVPTELQSLGFLKEGSLWVKESAHPSATAVQLSKRYPFTKLGKVLGIETSRFLALHGDHLFYFDEPHSGRILGFCSLEEVYLQWLPLKDSRFLLLLSNGTETSEFYFSTPQFWQEQRAELARTAVMLGFGEGFEMLEELGQGSFAKVFRVRESASGAQFAAKRVGKEECSPSLLKMMIEERKVLAGLKGSSHVYQYKGFYETNEEYVLLTEYLPGVDLMSFLRMRLSLSLSDLKALLTGLLKGIKECHDRRVIHRDIKPQNVMVDLHTLRPTLIDFGLSLRPSALRTSQRRCGTVGYMAPEVYGCTGYSEKCDMFSFGVVAHLILMGCNPLKGRNYEETCRNSQSGKLELNQTGILDSYGPTCLAFLRRTLAPSPNDRCSASQALLSPFLLEKYFIPYTVPLLNLDIFQFSHNHPSTSFKLMTLSNGTNSATPLQSHNFSRNCLLILSSNLRSSCKYAAPPVSSCCESRAMLCPTHFMILLFRQSSQVSISADRMQATRFCMFIFSIFDLDVMAPCSRSVSKTTNTYLGVFRTVIVSPVSMQMY